MLREIYIDLFPEPGSYLPVPISTVRTPIRVVRKGRPATIEEAFPVLKPSSWVSYALSIGGEALLGGHPLESEDAYCNMLASFLAEIFNHQSGLSCLQET